LIRGREGQKDGLRKLVGVGLRELRPKQATVQESKEGGSAVERDVGRHPHRSTASAEPTDDPVAEELVPGNLLQEERDAELEFLVGELGRLVVFEVGVDALIIKHLVPLGGGGETESEGEQAKMRRAILTLVRRQLRLGLLLVLIPRLGKKELGGLTIVWGHMKGVILLLAIRNFKCQRDLDLIRLSRDVVLVQGH
jgi:hypothetical protein